MKRSKPTTPSRRHMTFVTYKGVITKNKPEKSLTSGFKRFKGRSGGKITTRHKGGGHKRLYRFIDFKYFDKENIPFTVKSVEYDPNRTGFIGLVTYKDGEKRYILLPKSVSVGDSLITAEDAPVNPGNRLLLKNIPIGTSVFNIEIQPRSLAKIARSAGNYAQVVAKDAGYVDLKMPSGEIRKIRETSWASVGEVSNEEKRLVNIGKAGRNRWLGKRPTVRGSAMNPVDHPYGGGEGRSGRGMRRAKSKWGKPTGIGQKTRKTKKYSNKLIVSRRKVKRTK